jgi:hypothetical protein
LPQEVNCLSKEWKTKMWSQGAIKNIVPFKNSNITPNLTEDFWIYEPVDESFLAWDFIVHKGGESAETLFIQSSISNLTDNDTNSKGESIIKNSFIKQFVDERKKKFLFLKCDYNFLISTGNQIEFMLDSITGMKEGSHKAEYVNSKFQIKRNDMFISSVKLVYITPTTTDYNDKTRKRYQDLIVLNYDRKNFLLKIY